MYIRYFARAWCKALANATDSPVKPMCSCRSILNGVSAMARGRRRKYARRLPRENKLDTSSFSVHNKMNRSSRCLHCHMNERKNRIDRNRMTTIAAQLNYWVVERKKKRVPTRTSNCELCVHSSAANSLVFTFFVRCCAATNLVDPFSREMVYSRAFMEPSALWHDAFAHRTMVITANELLNSFTDRREKNGTFQIHSNHLRIWKHNRKLFRRAKQRKQPKRNSHHMNARVLVIWAASSTQENKCIKTFCSDFRLFSLLLLPRQKSSLSFR